MFVGVKTYPTQDMIALAYAVDRINSGYVKFSNTDKKSNKDIFMMQIAKFDRPVDFDSISSIEVTDADRTNALQVDKLLSHLMLKSIKGFDNTFEQNIYTAISGEVITRNNLPILPFVPEFVRRETQKRATTRDIIANYKESAHIVDAKDAVGTAKILRTIYLSNFEKYMYVAVTASGNLIRFYIKDKFECGESIKITSCKVKGKEIDKVTDLKVTLLNFVRYKRT